MAGPILRRDILLKGLKAAAGIALLESLPVSAVCSTSVNDSASIDKYEKSCRWERIEEYDYVGKITKREAERIWLSRTGHSRSMTPERIEDYLDSWDNETFMHFFISEKNMLAINLIEPSAEELYAYGSFVASLKPYKGERLIREAYNRLREKIKDFNSNLDTPETTGKLPKYLHPAVLVSGKEGVCFDYAFALHDIYKRYGLDSRIVTAHCAGQNMTDLHTWTRLYHGGKTIDLDPTWYAEFRPLRKRE